MTGSQEKKWFLADALWGVKIHRRKVAAQILPVTEERTAALSTHLGSKCRKQQVGRTDAP